MRRLLQLGTLLLLLAAVLTPVSEMLDRWDAPGLANDTEMHLFAVVLLLALVLLVARVVSAVRQVLLLPCDGECLFGRDALLVPGADISARPFVTYRGSPPLRI